MTFALWGELQGVKLLQKVRFFTCTRAQICRFWGSGGAKNIVNYSLDNSSACFPKPKCLRYTGTLLCCDSCVSSFAPGRLPQSWSHDFQEILIWHPAKKLNFMTKKLEPKIGRLKAFCPWGMLARSCTSMPFWQATTPCLYFDVEKDSMDCAKSL